MDANVDWYSTGVPAVDHLEGDGEIEVRSISPTLDNELRTPIGSEDDGEVESIPVRDEISMDFFLGKKYGSLQIVRNEISQYSIENGYDIRIVKSEARRLRAVCEDGCDWRMHVSLMQNEQTFQIKSYVDSHSCARKVENRHATAKWVATNYLDRFKNQPTWEIPSIIETVRTDFNVNISSSLARRARSKAQKLNQGRGDQYKLLDSYAEEICKSNSGSTVRIQTYLVGSGDNEARVFERMYICIAACKIGLLQCGRPIICLDGCDLKGSCSGQLLTAVGIDGNDDIYPVAIANVELECSDSWMWFLQILKEDLNTPDRRGWTIVSDRQKGLIRAVDDQFGLAEHRYCLQHMYANFKNQFRGRAYTDAMFQAARAPTIFHFEKEMSKLEQISSEAHAWLRRTPPCYWASHAFSTIPKCDMGLNNLCESFNAVLLPTRDKPILTMFEMIRNSMMARIVKKYEYMFSSNDVLYPKIRKKLTKLESAARNWSPQFVGGGGGQFEVSNSYEQYTVNMNTCVCNCTRWELTGIPCIHSIPCIRFLKQAPENFVHPYYLRQTYLAMYSNFIHPISGQTMWTPVENAKEILPPERRQQPGRPKKHRVRDVDESSRTFVSRRKSTMKCSICRRQGHNSRTCPDRGSTSDAAGASASQDTVMGFHTFNGTQ